MEEIEVLNLNEEFKKMRKVSCRIGLVAGSNGRNGEYEY